MILKSMLIKKMIKLKTKFKNLIKEKMVNMEF